MVHGPQSASRVGERLVITEVQSVVSHALTEVCGREVFNLGRSPETPEQLGIREAEPLQAIKIYHQCLIHTIVGAG